MLEALKGNGAPAASATVHLAAVCPEPDEEAGEAMPFIEVGGPRPASPPLPPRLQAAPPRLAALEPVLPAAVALQPATVRPTAKVAPELVTLHHPAHEVSRHYAALFAQIAPEPAADGSVLLLTGLAPGAGTTTTLLNLAVSGCREHRRRIVVVDANCTRPAAAQRLGLVNGVGLAEVLQGKAALEAALQASGTPDLSVLPAGGEEAAGAWTAEALRWVLGCLRQRFDLVLVDAPPWSAAEMRPLLPAVDGVFLVLDRAEVGQAQVRDATRGLARRGGRVGGLIVTQ
jgi:Mrp family chromosome partitioning ATPase